MAFYRAPRSTALFGTALGLTLASLAVNNGHTEVIAHTNRSAAASIAPNGVQLASTAGGPSTIFTVEAPTIPAEPVSEVSANPPLIQKGTVLWRRTGDEADLPPTPKMAEELRRLRESLAQIQGSTSEQLTDLQTRLQTSQKTLAQVQDDQQRQERDLRAQTAEAVSNVANMAQENMRSMERVARNTSDRWFTTNQQLTQLETRLQSAITDVQQRQARADDKTQAYTDLKVSQASLETQLNAVREARQAAMEAELRAKNFTGQQLAGRDQLIGNLLTTTDANQKLTAEQLKALRETTDTKLAAAQAVQGTQFTALSNQLAGSQQLTVSQMQALKNDIAQQASTSQQLTAAQLAALKSETAARLESTEKVQAAKLDAVQAMQGVQFGALGSQLANSRQLTTAQLDSLRQETSTKLAAAQAVQGAQLAAVSNQLASNQQLTALQLAELRKVGAENRALASSETSNVATALRMYADTQLQQASANNAATIASLAHATNQSIATLNDQTNQRLGVMWQAAGQRAEQLAEAKANAVAASVAALQQQTAAQKVTPDQIRAISEKTVADSTPEFRALALKTMQDSQDYIRTVARTAVQDKQDPAMQTALADAARDVITKDDKVVFAIRKAVAEELQGVGTEASSASGAPVVPSTRLGPDRSLGDAAELDPNRMRIAQLLSPGTSLPAPDAAALAALSPAAGNAPQDAATGVGGQQSWSTPSTSLMRSRNRADWMDIRQYKVVVHEDDQTLEQLLGKVLKHAEPFTGPWQVRWKVSEENRDVMTEKFSLDAETTFEEFVSYLAQYVVNDRGVKLSFSLFDNERIIVISD